MINTKHLVRVGMAWVSIVYAVCYLGVWLLPTSRMFMMRYALHADTVLNSNYFGIGYFVSGLVIWNIVAVLGFGLFGFLYNAIKE